MICSQAWTPADSPPDSPGPHLVCFWDHHHECFWQLSVAAEHQLQITSVRPPRASSLGWAEKYPINRYQKKWENHGTSWNKNGWFLLWFCCSAVVGLRKASNPQTYHPNLVKSGQISSTPMKNPIEIPWNLEKKTQWIIPWWEDPWKWTWKWGPVTPLWLFLLGRLWYSNGFRGTLFSDKPNFPGRNCPSCKGLNSSEDCSSGVFFF